MHKHFSYVSFVFLILVVIQDNAFIFMELEPQSLGCCIYDDSFPIYSVVPL